MEDLFPEFKDYDEAMEWICENVTVENLVYVPFREKLQEIMEKLDIISFPYCHRN